MSVTEQPKIAQVRFRALAVSRFIVGGNPFAGFSHHDGAMDQEMKDYYTNAQIHATYRRAEQLGVTACIARTDEHMIGVLREYWEAGGTIQWIGQTAPERGPAPVGAQAAIENGASAIFVHGGETDHLEIHGRLAELKVAIDLIHAAGLPAGIAGHRPPIFEYAEEHLDCDFYMCSYYDPVPRDETPQHITQEERFLSAHRDRMTAFIPTLTKPVIHYKILAAGRNDPREGFARAAQTMRPTDAVCVGVFTKHRPEEIAQDIGHLKEALAAVGQQG